MTSVIVSAAGLFAMFNFGLYIGWTIWGRK
jgi:hypothetical protein